MPTVSSLNTEDFWQKLNRFAYKSGRELVEKALWLYYASKRPETPVWARSVIVGALAYFVMPIDAAPDYIPGVGYSDDLAVLAAAVGAVAFYIDEEVKRKAAATLSKWFNRSEQNRPRRATHQQAAPTVIGHDPQS